MNPEEIRKVAQTQQESEGQYEHRITVCTAASCLSSGSDKVKAALEGEVKRLGLEQQVPGQGCRLHGAVLGRAAGQDRHGGCLYQEITPEDAPKIIAQLGREPIKEKQFATDGPFFIRQTKVVLENCGVVDPDSFVDYIGHGGYEALIQALTEMTPQEVVDQMIRSGLRGRGGAGYPTGLKWSTVAKAAGKRKYVVCNGDEGDPGAFMDRSVLESDPYRVLEGMAIAAYAVGADSGYIYVRAEYPLAVKRLRAAIRQAERHNTLGNNICGTQFNFRVEVRLGAGAFVCGEETALLSSIEGHRGQPRPRPPFPAQSGLWGFPTLINNVETLANICPIIRNGGDWFASMARRKARAPRCLRWRAG